MTHANWFGGVYQDERNFFPQFAIDTETYREMFPEFVDARRAVERASSPTAKAAVVGEDLAKRFHWKVGDRVPIKGTIFPGTWEFNIRGIYTGSRAGRRHHPVLVPLQATSKSARTRIGRAWSAGTRCASTIPTHAVAVAKAIDESFANSPWETKTETEKAFAASFVKQMGNIEFLMLSIGGVVFFTLLLVTGNTMAIAVRERMRELAVLKAVGFSDDFVLAPGAGRVAAPGAGRRRHRHRCSRSSSPCAAIPPAACCPSSIWRRRGGRRASLWRCWSGIARRNSARDRRPCGCGSWTRCGGCERWRSRSPTTCAACACAGPPPWWPCSASPARSACSSPCWRWPRDSRQRWSSSGSPRNAIVRRAGATSEMDERRHPRPGHDHRGRARRGARGVGAAGQPGGRGGRRVSAEGHRHRRQRAGARRLAQGARRSATTSRSSPGAFFEPGLNELVVGRNVAGTYAGFDLGNTVKFGGGTWTVVGVFDAGGSAFDSEVWCDANVVKQVYKRPPNIFQSVTVRLTSRRRLRRASRTRSPPTRASPSRWSARSTTTRSSRARSPRLILVLGTWSAWSWASARCSARSTPCTRRSRSAPARSPPCAPWASARAAWSRRSSSRRCCIALVGGVLGCLAVLPLNGLTTGTMNWQTFSHLAFAFRVTPGAARRRRGVCAADGDHRRRAAGRPRRPRPRRRRPAGTLKNCSLANLRGWKRGCAGIRWRRAASGSWWENVYQGRMGKAAVRNRG